MAIKKGFSLIELVTVMIIVSVLAAVLVPKMQGRIDKAKWSEANATAGSLRRMVRRYVAEHGPGYNYMAIEGTLDTPGIQSELGVFSDDLSGNYFNQEDYIISEVDASSGDCVITIDGSSSSHPHAPAGAAVMDSQGQWTVTNGS